MAPYTKLLFMTLWVCLMVLNASSRELKKVKPSVKPKNKILPVDNRSLVKNYELALKAIFGIGVRLQSLLDDDQDENFLVSPISATAMVGQLMLGAEGEFRDQLLQLLSLPSKHHEKDRVHYYYSKDRNVTYDLPYSTLHLQLSSLLKALENSNSSIARNFTLKQASVVFVDEHLALKPQFCENLRNLYLVDLQSLNFSEDPTKAQKIINQWAFDHTNGLLSTILASPPLPTTSSVFANAVYFLAEWQTPFSDILNRRGLFNVSFTKQTEVTYMIGLIEQILYAESDDYRIISLPYKNEELGMYIMLPKPNSTDKYNIKQFAQNLKTNEVFDTMLKMKRHDVVVKIPKMSLSNSFSILKHLQKYRSFKKEVNETVVNKTNVIDTLEKKVDLFMNFTATTRRDIYLTNAAENENLRIDDIVQQVVLSVNEKGTEAAAITASVIDYIGGSKNFVIDRPFLFFIRHEATLATLFWGTISNPSA